MKRNGVNDHTFLLEVEVKMNNELYSVVIKKIKKRSYNKRFEFGIDRFKIVKIRTFKFEFEEDLNFDKSALTYMQNAHRLRR